ncbi:riboflavin synthase [Thermoflexibacter ruber]|uniref:Riboflavin synthase n=1 Tax=Thermoflexibacter ruber TaxID=1003 RepID=A0A1I2GAB6_9BACT|nr:riboflavin synthase [Thermoflexibacter ruber]SFF13686.1 riboflavin synthase alpha chain [Thermoflexibacter ruber]
MFTGIIETEGIIHSIEKQQDNIIFWVESNIAHELKIDQSIAHDGVCLTVTAVAEGKHCVTAIYETLQKTNLGSWEVGKIVNLERCMPANGRFDGHFVQGHVDQTGVCTSVISEHGSWRFSFAYEVSKGNFTVEKGSIAVNGVSLTVVDSSEGSFSVAIIPYTYEHTNFKEIGVGTVVNLEFDIIGKYLKKLFEKQNLVKSSI